MGKSSRGNPYHDERGRFTTADGRRAKERNYIERAKAIENGDYNKKEAKDLRALTRRALESPNGGRLGKWNIQRGGYGLQYEGYYDGEAAFGVMNDEVQVYNPKFRAYAEDFSASSGYSIEPASFNGDVEDIEKLPTGRYRVPAEYELSGRGKDVFVDIDREKDQITVISGGRVETYTGPISEWVKLRSGIQDIPCECNGYCVTIENDGDDIVMTNSPSSHGFGYSPIYEDFCQGADKVVFNCGTENRHDMEMPGYMMFGERKIPIALRRKGYTNNFSLYIDGRLTSGTFDGKYHNTDNFNDECERLYCLYNYNYRRFVEYK